MRSLAELQKDLAKRRGETAVSGISEGKIANSNVQRSEKQRVKESHEGDAGSQLLSMLKGNQSHSVPPFPSAIPNGNTKPGCGPSEVQILELAPALLLEPPLSNAQSLAPQEPDSPQEPDCANIAWSRDNLLRWRPRNGLHDRNLLPRTMMMPREGQAESESVSAALNTDGPPAGREPESSGLAGGYSKAQIDHQVSADVLEEAFEEAFRFSSDEEDTPELSLGFRKWFNRDSSADTTTTTMEAWVSTDAGSGEETTDEDEAGSQKCATDNSPGSHSKSGTPSVAHLHAMLSQAAQHS